MAASLPVASWIWLAVCLAFAALWLDASRLSDALSRTVIVGLNAALLLTALNAATRAFADLDPSILVFARTTRVLEPLAWTLLFIAWVKGSSGLWSSLSPPIRRLLGLVAACGLFGLAFEAVPRASTVRQSFETGFAVTGLAALTPALRQLDEDQFWRLKHLFAAAVTILVFDLFAALSELFGTDQRATPADLPEALATLFAAPLVLVSLGRLRRGRVPNARRGTFAAYALFAGLVTLYGALIGWLAFEALRLLPGLQPGFVHAIGLVAILALGLLTASRAVGAILGKHVGPALAPAVDFEREWLRFLDAVAAKGSQDDEDLPLRVIRAITEAAGAAGGAIWLHRGQDRFELLALRGLAQPVSSLVDIPGLSATLREVEGPIELDGRDAGRDLPPWIDRLPRLPQSWLFLPLVHRGRAFGFIILSATRVRRALDLSEKQLLRILAREAASYLAEDRATRALAEAQQFSAFARRFAFLVHDLKNLLAELALAADNARRHLEEPAFRRDLLQTLDGSVARLQRLLERLRVNGFTSSREPVDLRLLVTQARGSRPQRRPRVVADVASLPARIDPERLLAALRYLLDNAFEATNEEGPVDLRLRRRGDLAIIEVIDRGPGLAAEASRGALFRPFATTKPKGLGIGLVAAREHVESLGGRLELESLPGRGTIARILLPVTEPIA